MHSILEAIRAAVGLIASGDATLGEIVLLSLGVSLSAVALATLLGLPLGAVLAGLGRASAEVGAVMIVGGNIDGVTRVMTTTIALETSKGDLPLALGLGIVLIAIILALNAAAYLVKEAAQRRYG